jgi:hypothetical protein
VLAYGHAGTRLIGKYCAATRRREILELSTVPLEKNVFEVPAGFKQVDALPGQSKVTWGDRLKIEWRLLESAFATWVD